MAIAALVKAISLGYLLGAASLSLAALWWWVLRPRLPGPARAQAGFLLLTGALGINTTITVLICLAVINGAMPMTTNFFHHLMYGGWSAGIAMSGVLLLGLSMIISWMQWRRGRLPRRESSADAVPAGELPGLPRGVRARFTHATQSLCLAGAWRPELWINPALWRELAGPERRLAVAHELRHLARRDNLKRLMLEALAALYFALPWARHWAAQYELDSELAVDHACRKLDETTYRGLILRLTQRQFTPVRLHTAAAHLSAQSHTERLRVLAAPPAQPQALFPLAVVLLGMVFSQALALALLSHSVSRCFITCYLGY
jgi:hypothetical protein